MGVHPFYFYNLGEMLILRLLQNSQATAMQYQTFRPHPALQPYIESYWTLGLRNDAKDNLESCIVPDGNTSLMFIHHPLQRRNTSHQQVEKYTEQCLLVGQKTQPVFYTFPVGEWVQTCGVRFRPLGLRAFLNISQSEIKDQSLDATLLFGKEILQLADQLRAGHAIPNIPDLLNNFFLQRIKTSTAQLEMIDHFLRYIFVHKGQLKLTYLQQNARISYRQIDRLFKQHLGLSPKAYARIVRFNHCVFLHRHQEFRKLTDLAYAGGYFDQMHFIKEVKHFTHRTPKQYFTRSDQMDQAFDDLLSRRFEKSRQRVN